MSLLLEVKGSIDIRGFCAKAVHNHQLKLAKVMWNAAIDATPGPGLGRWSSNLVNSWRLSRGAPIYESSSIRAYLADADIPISDYPDYQVSPTPNFEIGMEAISKYTPGKVSNVYLTNAAEDALNVNYATDVNYGVGIYSGSEPKLMMEKALQAGATA
jgi:hypothetical protein